MEVPSQPAQKGADSFLSSVSKAILDKFSPKTDKLQAEAPLPEYPSSLWDYLDGSYHSDLAYMPSRDDRLYLSGDEQRLKIWDFFFRIDPSDIGKPQKREIEKLIEHKSRATTNYRDQRNAIWRKIQQDLGRFLSLLESLSKQIDQSAFAELNLRIDELHQVVSMIQKESESQGELHDDSHLLSRLRLSMENVKITLRSAEWEALSPGLIENIKKADGEVDFKTKLQNYRDAIGDYISQLEPLERDYLMEISFIDQRTSFLSDSIQSLIRLIPKPPSEEYVGLLLQEELENLKKKSIEKAALGTRLESIGYIDWQNCERERSNPITFISPAELQEPDKIPPPYLPPQLNRLQRLSERVKAEIASRVEWPLLQSNHLPDRVKHLQAKRHAGTGKGVRLFYGVYFVEFIMIGDDMMTMVSLFYDFISGKTKGERVTEVYFRDVIAIEQTQEYREIPIDFQDPDALQFVEDMPAFHISLPSGDRHSITFINDDYLRQVLDNLGVQDRSAFTDGQTINLPIFQETLDSADAAINVLRHRLRMHKT